MKNLEKPYLYLNNCSLNLLSIPLSNFQEIFHKLAYECYQTGFHLTVHQTIRVLKTVGYLCIFSLSSKKSDTKNRNG